MPVSTSPLGIGSAVPLGESDELTANEADYLEMFEAAGLDVLHVHRPLGTAEDGFAWVSEYAVSPWTIYVLGSSNTQPS